MNSGRFKFKEIHKVFLSSDYTDSSIPEDIFNELKTNNQLTEEIFLRACKKVYKNHLRQLKQKTKIDFLFLEVKIIESHFK